MAGLTLVEVVIVLAVVALLAAIAWPMYQDSVRKARRADAVAALTAVQQAQERWRGNRAAYTLELSALPTASPPGLGLPALSANGHYVITIDAASATGYTVTATARGSQADDNGCQRLRIRVDGGNVFQGAAGDGPGAAFDETAGNRCWSR